MVKAAGTRKDHLQQKKPRKDKSLYQDHRWRVDRGRHDAFVTKKMKKGHGGTPNAHGLVIKDVLIVLGVLLAIYVAIVIFMLPTLQGDEAVDNAPVSGGTKALRDEF